MDKWDKRFLDMAEMLGSWSKDKDYKVGAVIVDQNNRIVSTGYNGLPMNVSDSVEIYSDDNRVVIHAEQNALLFAKQGLVGCTIYTAPLTTCAHCAASIIQSGITKVVSVRREMNTKWDESAKVAAQLYKVAGVELIEYVELDKT